MVDFYITELVLLMMQRADVSMLYLYIIFIYYVFMTDLLQLQCFSIKFMKMCTSININIIGYVGFIAK